MIEVGTLCVNFSPSWINNRVGEMAKTSWYVDMHNKARDLNDKEYDEFASSCRNVRMYSRRMVNVEGGWL